MKPILAALGAGLLGVAMAAPAAAVPVTIDFEEFAPGDVVSGPGVFAGVTFSSDVDIVIHNVDPAPPDLGGARAASGSNFTHDDPFRADFASPTTFVSVAMGDFGQDEELLFLRAFDADGNLLDEALLNLAIEPDGGPTLSVLALGIAYVLFGSTGQFPNSVYFDNFTYEAADTAEIAEPASLTLAAAGLGAFGLLRLRRRRAD